MINKEQALKRNNGSDFPNIHPEELIIVAIADLFLSTVFML